MPKTKEVHPAFHPIAFVFSLILAPIMVAALFFWVAFIPVFAVMLGAIPYLVFGTPVMLWIATQSRATFWGCALGGLLAQALFVISAAIGLKTGVATSLLPNWNGLQFLALWGIPFSAAWCGAFAVLYNSFATGPDTIA
ncbi:hypothetical protein MCELHM10_01940 [Paracoccaceae bacterium]|jgi:hypothetical protein